MRLYAEGISDFKPWSGAVSTWDELETYDKIEELESNLDELYPDGMSETDLNDLLWFEPELVYEWVGLYYNENTGEVSVEPFDEDEEDQNEDMEDDENE